MAQQDLGHDISGALATYAGFTTLLKWAALVCAAFAALVIILIS